MFTVIWDQHERHLSSIHDLEHLLEELHVGFVQTEPTLVTVELSQSGDSLAIGLGRERSVLNYINGSKDPPYFTSKGEVELDEGISFRFGGEWSEFPMKNSVPTPVALKAMRHFCSTGELTQAIEWEQD